MQNAGLRISVDSGAPAEVTGLTGTVAQANSVFSDLNLNGATNGTFSIESQRRASTQGASFAGVTFDGTSAVDWPGGELELDQDSLSLDLVARIQVPMPSSMRSMWRARPRPMFKSFLRWRRPASARPMSATRGEPPAQ